MSFYLSEFLRTHSQRKHLSIAIAILSALVLFSGTANAQMFMMPVADENSEQQLDQNAPESSSNDLTKDPQDQSTTESIIVSEPVQDTSLDKNTSLITDFQIDNFRNLIHGIPISTEATKTTSLLRSSSLLSTLSTPVTVLSNVLRSLAATESELFGWKVIVSGDTLFISAPSLGITDRSGYVNVYNKVGSDWTLVQQLTPTVPDLNMTFGSSMSLSGNTLAIGAMPATTTPATIHGKAYVFDYNGTEWTETAVLTPTTALDGEEYARSIFLDADLGILAVGSPHRSSTNLSGRIVVFEKLNGTWQEVDVLNTNPSLKFGKFGFDVTMDGTDIISGADSQTSNGVSGAGEVFVFSRNVTTGNWEQSQQIVSDNPTSSGRFGFKLAKHNGKLIVAAPAEFTSTSVRSGVVHVLEKNGSGDWIHTERIEPSTPVASALFGITLLPHGSDLYVGAILDNDRKGAVYQYTDNGSSYQETAKFVASDAAQFGFDFGVSIAKSDTELFIGDSGHTEGGSYFGVVYLQSLSTQPIQYTLTIETSGTGTITSSPAGIDCGADCSETYDENTLVELTASPDAGFVFGGWSGDADCSDGSVTMTSNITCTATFNPAPTETFTLNVTKSGTGVGTVTSLPIGIDCGTDCSETYDENTAVVLTAVADSGSTFQNWSGDADCLDGNVTMDSDKNCIAVFNQIQEPSSLWTKAIGSMDIFRLFGKVGIGTSTPQEALHVVGNIRANGLCIGNDCRSEWPSGQTTGSGNGDETDSPLPFPPETDPAEIIEYLKNKLSEQRDEVKDLNKAIKAQQKELKKLEKLLRKQDKNQDDEENEEEEDEDEDEAEEQED